MIDKKSLQGFYERYGFSLIEDIEDDFVLVFSISNGYFENIEIVPYAENYSDSVAKSNYGSLGHTCKVRSFSEAMHAETLLFNGFFSVEVAKSRILNDYNKFSRAIVEPYGKDTVYKYLNVPYWINNKEGDRNLVYTLLDKLNSDRPILFLIEAAAGFGKTCTAQEIVREIIELEDKLPLFAELSRYRQARVFRHILLEEIDRSFPNLNSRLVHKEIVNGKIIPVLDGFDELLRESDGVVAGGFEEKEPMLETIGEYLSGRAKVILTTRRTILFDGDEFHQWLDRNKDKFDIVKIRIGEPRIKDWINRDRYDALESSGFEINYIANPVLLSYLRCVPDQMFYSIAQDPDKLVASYFDFMLEREKERQALQLDIIDQHKILTAIAEDMINYQYTSEDRDYIVSFILDSQSDLIDEMIQSYASSERPTKEVIANKLASHALLDKSARTPNKISFINDFVLGNYVAECILSEKEWLNDDWRFLEAAAISYQPRGKVARAHLYNKIYPVLDFTSATNKIDASIRLDRRINFTLTSGEAEGLTIEGVMIGEQLIKTFQFNDCSFINCTFNISLMSDVTFLNCAFFSCEVTGVLEDRKIHLLGSVGDDSELRAVMAIADVEEEILDHLHKEEKYVLEKFWPVGREKISHKHRPIKGICVRTSDLSPERLYSAIQSLKRKGILVEPQNSAFVEINIEKISEIKAIVGRG